MGCSIMVIQSANLSKIQNLTNFGTVSSLSSLIPGLLRDIVILLYISKLFLLLIVKKFPLNVALLLTIHSYCHMFEDTAGVTFTCVSTTDRFNFGSLERICQIRVTVNYIDVLTAIPLCG